MDPQIESMERLLAVLNDRSASIAERDDAAMDLAGFSDALGRLVAIARDATEDKTVLSSCGESIASIWIRDESFDSNVLGDLAPPARAEAYALIKVKKPEWLRGKD